MPLILSRRDYCSSKQFMKLDFNGSAIDTDYYSSRDCERGVPWIYVASSTWHVLLPHPPSRKVVSCRAIPVTDREDADGWRWRLELANWHLPLFRRCFVPFRPGFPARGNRFERAAVLYCGIQRHTSSSSFFGSIQPGLQECGRPILWLARGK